MAAFGGWQAALDCASSEANQRWRPLDRLHMTLRYLGERISEEQLAGVLRELATVAAGTTRFELDFDRIEYWPQAKVLVAVTAPSHELEHLFGRIETGMRGCGFLPEPRPARPHVTLAYLAGPPPAAVSAQAGPLLPAPTLGCISLMRNAGGGGYASLGWFPLQEPA